ARATMTRATGPIWTASASARKSATARSTPAGGPVGTAAAGTAAGAAGTLPGAPGGAPRRAGVRGCAPPEGGPWAGGGRGRGGLGRRGLARPAGPAHPAPLGIERARFADGVLQRLARNVRGAVEHVAGGRLLLPRVLGAGRRDAERRDAAGDVLEPRHAAILK